MAQVKGRFITMVGMLMVVYKDARKEVDDLMFAKIGKHFNMLDPEGWYDTKWTQTFLDAYIKASPSKELAIVTFGRQIYPALKKANLLPPHLKTPLDYIKHEAETFISVHKGTDVIPRKFIKAVNKEIIVEAPTPGYNLKLSFTIKYSLFEGSNDSLQ